MPGAAAQYPYYAPLGALVAMYENVSGSMKQGVQTLVGLGIGIGLAFLLVSVTDPSPVTVAIVMGLGVLLAGLPRLGAGRDWIPTAALLVLLVGGNNPDDFSFGYLLQMGVGVVVGITVNMLVFPPLHFKAAALSLAELRWALAKQLSDMGEAMRKPGRPSTRTGPCGRKSSRNRPVPSGPPSRRPTRAGRSIRGAGSTRTIWTGTSRTSGASKG